MKYIVVESGLSSTAKAYGPFADYKEADSLRKARVSVIRDKERDGSYSVPGSVALNVITIESMIVPPKPMYTICSCCQCANFSAK